MEVLVDHTFNMLKCVKIGSANMLVNIGKLVVVFVVAPIIYHSLVSYSPQ